MSQLACGYPPFTSPGTGMRFVSLRRTWPYVRPYLRQMITMLVAASVGVGAATVIPLVTKGVIDGPIAHHHRTGVVVLAVLALSLGTIEAVSAWLRRYTLAIAALGMETDMRDDLYRHLQSRPVSFHAGWQSGQLLSRATSDISTIRRFVGFGFIFLIVNTAAFFVIVPMLATLYWPLAIVVAVSAVRIVFLSHRFQRRYMEISRRVQDQVGDLATLIEEAATGIRITKAFGRRRLLGNQFGAQAETLHDSTLERVTLLGTFWSNIDFVPNFILAVVLLARALAVGPGGLTLRAT